VPEPSSLQVREDPTCDAVDVAVVGAGIVGLAFALAGARAGLSIALIAPPEIAKKPQTDRAAPLETRVYALSPATKQFLQQIEVWDRLDQERVGIAYDMRVFAPGAKWSELHMSAYQSGVGALAYIVGHDALTGVLRSAVASEKKTRLVPGSVSGLAVGANGVDVFSESPGLSAQLVVGADGIDSVVRQESGIVARKTSLGATGLVANFLVEKGHRGCAFQWFTSEGVIALLPLPGDAMSLVWSAPAAVAAELADASAADLAVRLAPHVQAEVGQLTPASAVFAFPLQRLRVQHWVKPRVAVIGDAAHVIHPLAGQGLNLGLDDARVLIEILSSRGLRGVGELRVLRNFERRRKEAVFTMGSATDALHLLFGGSSGILATLGALGMASVNRISPLKNQLIGHALRNAAIGF
jgi:2-octaprenylphenol hydroxylase